MMSALNLGDKILKSLYASLMYKHIVISFSGLRLLCIPSSFDGLLFFLRTQYRIDATTRMTTKATDAAIDTKILVF